MASVVLFAVLFLAPVFLQDVQHRSATVAGLVLLPQGIVMGLASWLGNSVVEPGRPGRGPGLCPPPTDRATMVAGRQ